MSNSPMTGKAGDTVIGLGNDAIARGALEAGVQFAAAYPGTPSSEILGNLATISKESGIYVEWSVNEKVAFEAATAAAWTGLRAMASMKLNGLFVLLDSLVNIAYTGHGPGGLVLVVADDPFAHSSTAEGDARPLGFYSDVVVIEPSTHQEAKDIIPYAFELSEKHGVIVMVRETTRLAHSRAPFKLGKISRTLRTAKFDYGLPLHNLPRPHLRHGELHARLEKVRKEEFEKSPWNRYDGPAKPSLLIITSGIAWKYIREAVETLQLQDVGILRIATISPLPKALILDHLKTTTEVLFFEEVDPYLEEQIRSLASEMPAKTIPKFYGKLTGHIPNFGEVDINLAIKSIAAVKKLTYTTAQEEYINAASKAPDIVPRRLLTFCPGCPHRPAYYSIYRAIKRNKGKGIVTGDIGCYSLGVFYHGVMRNQHSMGAGVGIASGLGKLDQFGLTDPIISVVGDSTFFHACLPALVNIVYNQSKAVVCVLDNNATAMTGFQPHPGTGLTATGDVTSTVPIERVLKGIGFQSVSVVDPFNIKDSIDTVYKALNSEESQAIVFRRECALITNRQRRQRQEPTPVFKVDTDKCFGEKCKICSVEFNCPACVWDNESNKARIEVTLCNGCGVCVDICPHNAIYQVEK
ncbi:MAG: thiamine pyrophosphate-dependent enzyme [Candidatus Hermodarchaeota archaeon]|nr:thiamine pyrophosphate-dependent enzyme [Candidatus Hermodarchaeota archaeon]